MTAPKRLTVDDYTVGLLCALPREGAAARYVMDEQHVPPSLNGNRSYFFGRMGGKNVVLGILPSGRIGIQSALEVATTMYADFKIEYSILIGIAGGVPNRHNDIRLGDVVVSNEVKQYDSGKLIHGRMHVSGPSYFPCDTLLRASASVQAENPYRIPERFLHRGGQNQYKYPGANHDVLFHSIYEHIEGEDNCDKCDKDQITSRKPRESTEPRVHYGLVGSANAVLKDGTTRRWYGQELNLLCVEMEAAGVVEKYKCLVVRGICDYADSHKNKQWQDYAAFVAAAYTEDLLSHIIPPETVELPVQITPPQPDKYPPLARLSKPEVTKAVSAEDIAKWKTEAKLIPFKSNYHTLSTELFGKKWYKFARSFETSGLSPDCKYLCLMKDKLVRIYAIGSGKHRVSICEAAVPDGEHFRNAVIGKMNLATITGRAFQLWNIETTDDTDIGKLEIRAVVQLERKPECLAIFETESQVRVAIGDARGVRIYTWPRAREINETYGKITLSPTIPTTPKILKFSDDGSLLISITRKHNKINIWQIFDDGERVMTESICESHQIFSDGSNGITAASVWRLRSGEPYFLCASTGPSHEGRKHDGTEWTFLSPATKVLPCFHGHAYFMPDSLHRDKFISIHGVTISPLKNSIAFLDSSGNIGLMPLFVNTEGYIEGGKIIPISSKLNQNTEPYTVDIRFDSKGDRLVAVDRHGRLVTVTFDTDDQVSVLPFDLGSEFTGSTSELT